MKKPIIGVMPLFDDEKESLWMLPGYMDGIRQFGGIPIMFPLSDDETELIELIGLCDGILFTGGQDIAPSLYNEEKSINCGISCELRDSMESIVLKQAMYRNKPILGICRGIQIINVLLGGTLYQDLPSEINSRIEHHMTRPYDKIQHTVSIKEGTPLFELLGKSSIGVNSYHHQAIKQLADNLVCMAESEDGLVEAIVAPDYKFLWAVQWHPEFSYKSDINSQLIFQKFLETCLG